MAEKLFLAFLVVAGVLAVAALVFMAWVLWKIRKMHNPMMAPLKLRYSQCPCCGWDMRDCKGPTQIQSYVNGHQVDVARYAVICPHCGWEGPRADAPETAKRDWNFQEGQR